MSNLKKVFRDNIVAPYNKYSLSQEKLGKVLKTNSSKNTCVVSYKNIDGITVIKEDVPVKKTSQKGILGGFPSVGDYVELKEVGKVIRITGIVDKNRITEANNANKDTHSGKTDYAGHLGI